MKYQVMFDAVPIQCETASQAVALAKEITLTRRARSNGASHSDQDTAPLFAAVGSFGKGCRRFTEVLIKNPDGLSADSIARELAMKNIEGGVSAMKNFLKRRGFEMSDMFEETNQGERFFRIRPGVFAAVKKALEVQ